MRGAAHASGFWHGFSAVFVGARDLLRLRPAWPYALVPAVVFLLLEAGFLGLALQLLQPWVEGRLSGGGTLQSFGAAAASWLSVALSAALGWVVSALLAPALSAPALERIATLVEAELRVPERSPLGLFAEFWCGFRSLALGLSFSVPLLIGLTLLEFLVPPLAVVATPLKLLIGALGVAWGLFDYPLTLRGVGARQRLAFMRQHASVVLGFGVSFALLFWLPCCGILLLPVGVAAATRLCCEIQYPASLQPRHNQRSASGKSIEA